MVKNTSKQGKGAKVISRNEIAISTINEKVMVNTLKAPERKSSVFTYDVEATSTALFFAGLAEKARKQADKYHVIASGAFGNATKRNSIEADIQLVHEESKKQAMYDMVEYRAFDAWQVSGMCNVTRLDVTRGMLLSMDQCIDDMPDVQKGKPIALTVKKTTGRKTLSINPTEGVTDNDLINRVCLQYDGASFKSLPEHVQAMFNTPSRAKYPAVSGYLKQLIADGKGCHGQFAELIRLHGAHNITSNMIKAVNLDTSTKGRFKDALSIFQSR